MSSQIELYEQMCALSAGMVEAARSHDWDRLIELESQVARLRMALMAADDGLVALPADALERKRELVQRILEDDAEVRRHTEPWMEHVRQFLGQQNKARTMQKAYALGSDPGAARIGA